MIFRRIVRHSNKAIFKGQRERPADVDARLGADADRYSFIVSDFHRLLLAGLPAHRAARVADEMMAAHKPAVWISDRYSAQQKHGERHQTCLAHPARDTAFAFEHGSDDLPFRFKLWLGRAFDLAKVAANFAASTLPRKKQELEKQLTALLAVTTDRDLARQLQAKIGRARDQLLIFREYPREVDVPNNRPSVSVAGRARYFSSRARRDHAVDVDSVHWVD